MNENIKPNEHADAQASRLFFTYRDAVMYAPCKNSSRAYFFLSVIKREC